MEIYPLQIGKVDWETYIKVAQDFLGQSPTRGIDAAKIPTDKPIAFLKTLDFNNRPLNVIGQEYLYHHIFFSFIGVIDTYIISQLSERSRISVAYTERRTKSLVILSGTLKDWKDTIVYCCNKYADTDVRLLCNEIHNMFETAGFQEIWQEYKKIPKADGSTVLSK